MIKTFRFLELSMSVSPLIIYQLDGEGHLFDEKDEIFTLPGAANPYGKIYQDKNCFAC